MTTTTLTLRETFKEFLTSEKGEKLMNIIVNYKRHVQRIAANRSDMDAWEKNLQENQSIAVRETKELLALIDEKTQENVKLLNEKDFLKLKKNFHTQITFLKNEVNQNLADQKADSFYNLMTYNFSYDAIEAYRKTEKVLDELDEFICSFEK